MNALIALLHFCEVHGPCVVFCTQTIHSHDNKVNHATSSSNNNQENTSMNIPIIKSLPTTNPIPIQSSRLSYNNTQASPASTNSSTPSSSFRKEYISSSINSSFNHNNTNNTSCAACTAQLPLINNGNQIMEARQLITIDEEDPSIQYIGTTKSPQQPHLYKAVRLACVRSLTAEFCQGRDGPALFGDEENGYVMSYMFKLRDSQARGEARFYSLIMLMTDRAYLISCWPFLVSAFRSMALNLQERANFIFQKEKDGMRHSSIMSYNSRRPTLTSQDQFYRRRSNTALRSLGDLLGIRDIYTQIQAQFSYILKLSSRKRMEKLTLGRRESPLYQKLKKEFELKKKQKELLQSV